LSTEELRALLSQGFVSAERRAKHTYYKLRFRLAGRQRVRYLGTDPEEAGQLQRILEELQARRRHKSELARRVETAARQLRGFKRILEPLVLQAGYRCHGQAIRRPRT
jgi:hypothetical protein